MARQTTLSLIAITHILAAFGCAPWRGDVRIAEYRPSSLAAELAARAEPLPGFTDGGEPDVAALWQMTRDARVVALGEATHGTREMRRLMSAMVERAARDERPLAIALELDFHTGLRIDAWVRERWFLGAPLSDLALAEALSFAGPVVAVAEYRDLFASIRAYNRTVAPERAVRVFGIDTCLIPSCSEDLEAYFAAVDPRYHAQAVALLAAPRRLWSGSTGGARALAAARMNLGRVRARLDERRVEYIEARGAAAHEAAVRLVWHEERRLDFVASHVDPSVVFDRDRNMADSVVWMVEALGERGRGLVLAHNGHVGRGLDRLPNGRMEIGSVMGRALADRYGDAYVVVHMTFDVGSFLAHGPRTARQRRYGGAGRLRAFAVGAAPRGTLEATLRQTQGAYALDLRAVASDGALGRYLHTRHWGRQYGSAWRRLYDLTPSAWTGLVPAEDFDVLVMFPHASPTTPYLSPDGGASAAQPP